MARALKRAAVHVRTARTAALLSSVDLCRAPVAAYRRFDRAKLGHTVGSSQERP